ncbi:MAG: glycosyltransferase family 9 protein, partial [Candidatus Kapaibacterium sp.]
RIGDVLVSTPVFRALRTRFPDARIDVLLGRHNASMAAALAAWGIGAHVYEKSPAGIIRLLLKARRSHDVVVDMMDNPSRTSSMLLRLLAPAWSVGFDNGRSHGVTHPVDLPDRSRVHIVECMTELLGPFGIDPAIVDRRPAVPGLTPSHTPSHTIDILVHLSAGKESLWWGETKFRELAGRLRGMYPEYRIAIGCAPEHRVVAARIAASCHVDIVPECASILHYAERMMMARMIVTPDTSVVHIASALSLPAVVLYAKPHPDRMVWTPYHTPSRTLIATDERGVTGISVDGVVDAVRSLHDETGALGSR